MKNGFGSVNAVTVIISDAMSPFMLKTLERGTVVGLTTDGRSCEHEHGGLLLYDINR